SFNGAAPRLYTLGLTHACLDFHLNALEQRPEGLEVFARLSIRDLLSCTLFGVGADMAKDRDVVRADNIRKLGSQFIHLVARSGGGRCPSKQALMVKRLKQGTPIR